MKTKTITNDCNDTCNYMKVDKREKMICMWGSGKEKLLVKQKGKKSLTCKLKR